MNKKGFTLIELLVVVLIIGILSSVALPQYQKTVLKSRAAEAWTNLSALTTAGKIYCLENPSYHGSLTNDDLSVSVENSKYFGYYRYVSCPRSYGSSQTMMTAFYEGGKNIELGINELGYRVCKGDGCKELGFTTAGTDSSCLCGTGDSCFYMN